MQKYIAKEFFTMRKKKPKKITICTKKKQKKSKDIVEI